MVIIQGVLNFRILRYIELLFQVVLGLTKRGNCTSFTSFHFALLSHQVEVVKNYKLMKFLQLPRFARLHLSPLKLFAS